MSSKAWVKAMTALVSIATADHAVALIPQALALPSPGQPGAGQPRAQPRNRRAAPSRTAVRQLNDELELRVQARTAEFEAANERLREEVRERSQAEERLAASEQRYRQVIELIREALWIHCDGRIVFANSAAAADVRRRRSRAADRPPDHGHHRSARPRPRQRAHGRSCSMLAARCR